MTTLVTTDIGTAGGRDYSTLQTWADDCPLDLTVSDEIWKGESRNDSEFTAGIFIGGVTTDAGRFMWLTTAAGESFADHPDVETNPHRYDQSKGVGVRFTGAYAALAHLAVNYMLVEKLQWCWDTDWPGTDNLINLDGFNVLFRHFIYQSNRSNSTELIAAFGNSGVVDGTVILTAPGGHSGQALYSGNSGNWVHGVSFVTPSDSSGGTYALLFGYSSSTPQVIGCACFNFSTPFGGSLSTYEAYGSDYNASDSSGSALPGSNSVGGLTYTDQFADPTLAGMDFRAVSSGSLGAQVPAAAFTATPVPNPIPLDGFDVAMRVRGDPQTFGGWEASGVTPPPPVRYRYFLLS